MLIYTVAVYWGLLAPSHFPSTFSVWTNASRHALNALYAFFEILFPRTEPLPWLALVPIIVVLCLYLGLAYLTNATEGFYVYDFLDPHKHSSGIVAAYIIGILVGAVVIFLIVRYLIMLRVWVTETKMHKTGKFTHRGSTGTVDHESKVLPLHHTRAK